MAYITQDASISTVAQNVSYLDMVVDETLRLYPPAPRYNLEYLGTYYHGVLCILLSHCKNVMVILTQNVVNSVACVFTHSGNLMAVEQALRGEPTRRIP